MRKYKNHSRKERERIVSLMFSVLHNEEIQKGIEPFTDEDLLEMFMKDGLITEEEKKSWEKKIDKGRIWGNQNPLNS